MNVHVHLEVGIASEEGVLGPGEEGLEVVGLCQTPSERVKAAIFESVESCDALHPLVDLVTRLVALLDEAPEEATC